MIGATRIRGRRVPAHGVDCWRCGVRFYPQTEHMVAGAPCRDCRDILAEQGDTTVWDVRALRAERLAS